MVAVRYLIVKYMQNKEYVCKIVLLESCRGFDLSYMRDNFRLQHKFDLNTPDFTKL